MPLLILGYCAVAGLIVLGFLLSEHDTASPVAVGGIAFVAIAWPAFLLGALTWRCVTRNQDRQP
jgi:hypothetical protein